MNSRCGLAVTWVTPNYFKVQCGYSVTAKPIDNKGPVFTKAPESYGQGQQGACFSDIPAGAWYRFVVTTKCDDLQDIETDAGIGQMVPSCETFEKLFLLPKYK